MTVSDQKETTHSATPVEAGQGGMRQDEQEVARLFKLAAESGYAWVQAKLGSFYEHGRGGLPKDDREAARLYKLAADQGDAWAQGKLAFFYSTGRGGLPKDDREAARLYKLAADQGNAWAQVNLAVLLRDGPWRPAEGRPRGRAPLQARRRPGRRLRRRAILAFFYRRAVAACRRTNARPCASTSSPPTRDMPACRPISGFLRAGSWRPAEGRARGRASLQARR